MRNIWKILLIVLICILLVCTAAFAVARTNFINGSGIRFLGSSVKFGTLQNCYFIDADTKEILGQGEFRAHMLAFDDYASGVINIDQYPLTVDDMNHFGFRRISSNLLQFSSSDIALSAEYLNEDWVRYYEVWVCNPDIQGQPGAIVTFIHEHDNLIIAVCAESEEEVWTNYEIYQECYEKGVN